VTEDALIDRIRTYAEANRLPPPVSPHAVSALEAVVGHPMPGLLRRLYLEVANGGFGTDGVLSLTDIGEWYSDEESLLEVQRCWTTAVVEEGRPYPLHVLPLMTLGCAIWWHIDFSTPVGCMWGWDPNTRCEEHRLFPERFTLAEWLADWLEGNRTFPEPPPVGDCRECAC
jgi:hypothetical protein